MLSMTDRPPRRIMLVPSARPAADASAEPVRRYKLARAMQVVEGGERFAYLKQMHD